MYHVYGIERHILLAVASVHCLADYTLVSQQPHIRTAKILHKCVITLFAVESIHATAITASSVRVSHHTVYLRSTKPTSAKEAVNRFPPKSDE
jgi:hypothetical protein